MMIPIVERLELGKYAGHSENNKSSIHNWFVYNHSFGKTLVSEILNHIKLYNGARVLDPFCGCGTTLLLCKEMSIESTGLDLMPLSVLVSRAKTSNYNIPYLRDSFREIKCSLNTINSYPKPDISIINKAFSQKAWDRIQSLRKVIENCTFGENRGFFLTALLSVVPKFGAFSNDGAFPRLLERPELSLGELNPTFIHKINRMIEEVKSFKYNVKAPKIIMGDIRKPLHKTIGKFDAIICSPPYPNRHDYTRVYAVELGTACLENNSQLKGLRSRMFRSHIEVKPDERMGIINNIKEFQQIMDAFSSVQKLDKRVPAMLMAYFQDIEKALKNLWILLKPNSIAAIVIGNVRFFGVVIPVDEIISSIGEKIGFSTQEMWVVRYRGNSPQQMRDFGKVNTRESVLFLRKKY